MFLGELGTTTERLIMMDQSPDDIFALFSRFDLDAEDYRVFRRPEAAETPVEAPPVPIAPEPILAERAAEVADAPENTSGVALRNLLRRVAPTRPMPSPVSAAAFAAGCISVCGAAGGTGSTTVAATLAGLIGKSRRRCAIFDATNDLTLPIYFGHQRVGSDQLRFAGLQSLFQPSVRILGPEHLLEPSTEKMSGGTLIESRLGHLAGQYDHLILDHPARFCEPTGAGVTILTAVPDVNSLAGASKLTYCFGTTAQQMKTVCVLNRFDHGMTLHREIFAWYKDHFEHVVTISPSHLVPEALAEGTTVIDWAPQTSVCNEFMHLFKVVAHLLGKTSLMEAHRPDDVTVDSERLPVCS